MQCRLDPRVRTNGHHLRHRTQSSTTSAFPLLTVRLLLGRRVNRGITRKWARSYDPLCGMNREQHSERRDETPHDTSTLPGLPQSLQTRPPSRSFALPTRRSPLRHQSPRDDSAFPVFNGHRCSTKIHSWSSPRFGNCCREPEGHSTSTESTAGR